MPTSYDVFLTHDWGDATTDYLNHRRVELVNVKLKEFGLVTWFDTERMIGNIRNQMTEGISNSKCVVVFVTQRYQMKVNSCDPQDNCYFEFNFAAHSLTSKKMVVVVIDPNMKNPKTWNGRLASELGSHLYIDFSAAFHPLEVNNPELNTRSQELHQMIHRIITEDYSPIQNIISGGNNSSVGKYPWIAPFFENIENTYTDIILNNFIQMINIISIEPNLNEILLSFNYDQIVLQILLLADHAMILKAFLNLLAAGNDHLVSKILQSLIDIFNGLSDNAEISMISNVKPSEILKRTILRCEIHKLLRFLLQKYLLKPTKNQYFSVNTLLFRFLHILLFSSADQASMRASFLELGLIEAYVFPDSKTKSTTFIIQKNFLTKYYNLLNHPDDPSNPHTNGDTTVYNLFELYSLQILTIPELLQFYSMIELKNAQEESEGSTSSIHFTVSLFHEINLPVSALYGTYSLAELKAGGYSVLDFYQDLMIPSWPLFLKILKEQEIFSLPELKESKCCSIADLLTLFTLLELKEEGKYNLQEIFREIPTISLLSLKEDGKFTMLDFKTFYYSTNPHSRCFKLIDLKDKASFSIQNFKENDFTLTELMNNHVFTSRECKEGGFSLKEFLEYNKSYSILQLKNEIGFTAKELSQAFSIYQLFSLGKCSFQELLDAGATGNELKSFGFQVKDFHQRNEKEVDSSKQFSIFQLKQFGFTIPQLLTCYSLLTLAEAKTSNDSTSVSYVYSLYDLKGTGGATVDDLKRSHFTIQEYQRVGYSVKDLLDANNKKEENENDEEPEIVYFPIEEIVNRQNGYSLKDFQTIPDVTFPLLKASGYSAKELKAFYGHSCSWKRLKEIGFTIKELKEINSNELTISLIVTDLGFSLEECYESNCFHFYEMRPFFSIEYFVKLIKQHPNELSMSLFRNQLYLSVKELINYSLNHAEFQENHPQCDFLSIVFLKEQCQFTGEEIFRADYFQLKDFYLIAKFPLSDLLQYFSIGVLLDAQDDLQISLVDLEFYFEEKLTLKQFKSIYFYLSSSLSSPEDCNDVHKETEKHVLNKFLCRFSLEELKKENVPIYYLKEILEIPISTLLTTLSYSVLDLMTHGGYSFTELMTTVFTSSSSSRAEALKILNQRNNKFLDNSPSLRLSLVHDLQFTAKEFSEANILPKVDIQLFPLQQWKDEAGCTISELYHSLVRSYTISAAIDILLKDCKFTWEEIQTIELPKASHNAVALTLQQAYPLSLQFYRQGFRIPVNELKTKYNLPLWNAQIYDVHKRRFRYLLNELRSKASYTLEEMIESQGLNFYQIISASGYSHQELSRIAGYSSDKTKSFYSFAQLIEDFGFSSDQLLALGYRSYELRGLFRKYYEKFSSSLDDLIETKRISLHKLYEYGFSFKDFVLAFENADNNCATKNKKKQQLVDFIRNIKGQSAPVVHSRPYKQYQEDWQEYCQRFRAMSSCVSIQFLIQENLLPVPAVFSTPSQSRISHLLLVPTSPEHVKTQYPGYSVDFIDYDRLNFDSPLELFYLQEFIRNLHEGQKMKELVVVKNQLESCWPSKPQSSSSSSLLLFLKERCTIPLIFFYSMGYQDNLELKEQGNYSLRELLSIYKFPISSLLTTFLPPSSIEENMSAKDLLLTHFQIDLQTCPYLHWKGWKTPCYSIRDLQSAGYSLQEIHEFGEYPIEFFLTEGFRGKQLHDEVKIPLKDLLVNRYFHGPSTFEKPLTTKDCFELQIPLPELMKATQGFSFEFKDFASSGYSNDEIAQYVTIHHFILNPYNSYAASAVSTYSAKDLVFFHGNRSYSVEEWMNLGFFYYRPRILELIRDIGMKFSDICVAYPSAITSKLITAKDLLEDEGINLTTLRKRLPDTLPADGVNLREQSKYSLRSLLDSGLFSVYDLLNSGFTLRDFHQFIRVPVEELWRWQFYPNISWSSQFSAKSFLEQFPELPLQFWRQVVGFTSKDFSAAGVSVQQLMEEGVYSSLFQLRYEGNYRIVEYLPALVALFPLPTVDHDDEDGGEDIPSQQRAVYSFDVQVLRDQLNCSLGEYLALSDCCYKFFSSSSTSLKDKRKNLLPAKKIQELSQCSFDDLCAAYEREYQTDYTSKKSVTRFLELLVDQSGFSRDELVGLGIQRYLPWFQQETYSRFSIAQFRAMGFTVRQLYDNGRDSIEEYRSSGYSQEELWLGGFTRREIASIL